MLKHVRIPILVVDLLKQIKRAELPFTTSARQCKDRQTHTIRRFGRLLGPWNSLAGASKPAGLD